MKDNNIWKQLFIGKKPVDRKHAPKIIEHVWLIISNVLAVVLLSILFTRIFLVSGEVYSKAVWEKLDTSLSKVLIALYALNYLAIITFTSRVLIIQKKCTFGKQLVITEVIFSLLMLSPIAMLIAMACLTYNEIVYI